MVLSLSKCVQRAVGLVGWSTVARKTNKRSYTQSYSFESVKTIERCSKILNSGKKKYSNDEVKQIREYLYLIAHIQIEAETEASVNK